MDIILDHVFKGYEGKQVLKDFSARIPEGKVTCVMGPSGNGKTTLIRLLLGLEKPDSGRITGVPETVSTVFQEDRLCPDFSVLSNVTLPSPGREKEARELLSRLGLEKELSTPARLLSGGMKRRVAIARALLYPGDMLILDEGFKGLDEENRQAVRTVILEKYRGKTILSVTHDEKETEAWGDGILCIPKVE